MHLPFLLLTLIPFLQGIGACRMDECASTYHRTMDYEGLKPQREARYCEVLTNYRNCLNSTADSCRGQLAFHSTSYYTILQLRQNWCESILAKAREERGEDGREESTCTLPSPSSISSSPLQCSIWGDPHIRTLDGRVHECAEIGARPMLDNRYLLVQVSSSRVREDSMVTAVSKVTVIIRQHNCTSHKRYEASSDTQFLPFSFVDGTTHSTNGGVKAVELLRIDADHIEIALKHAETTVIVRRQGPYLSVSITLPDTSISQGYFSSTSLPPSEQLCQAGCPLFSILPLPAALVSPSSFSSCYSSPIRLPLKLAIQRCKSVNVTDDFFDSCVFDLITTGDELLATMSRSAQSDLERNLYKGLPYSVGRMDFSPYEHLIAHQWTGCFPSSSTILSVSPLLPLLLAFLF